MEFIQMMVHKEGRLCQNLPNYPLFIWMRQTLRSVVNPHTNPEKKLNEGLSTVARWFWSRDTSGKVEQIKYFPFHLLFDIDFLLRDRAKMKSALLFTFVMLRVALWVTAHHCRTAEVFHQNLEWNESLANRTIKVSWDKSKLSELV